MRRVVSVVVASLIASSAVALSSVAEVGAVPSPDVVISQVYGGGGNSGATLTNDFIELYNRGTDAVPLDGWTVQYASQAGTTWAATPLTGTLPPGSYYLVQEAAGSGGSTALPTPDATGAIAMSATNGKVALVTSTAALSCGSDCDAATGVRDFVGYGSGANDFETAPTPTLSNTTAAIRAAGGATDTDNNSADFSVGPPTPRNCGAACVPPPPPIPPVRISEIHYDNDGVDTGEAIEVTGPAGVNLAGWSLVLYNGTGGVVYATILLGGVLPDEGAGLGAASFPFAGIQNGSPDGVALVEPLGTVVEFLSYEGSFVGSGGPANAVPSTDIGVIEDDTTPAGFSLQLLGGAWIGPVASSFGLVNFVPRNCPLATEVTPIHDAQGAGGETPCPGEDITIEGVVVADFEGAAPTLRGFYVQEQDADVDADPATSEALFVFNSSNNSVSVGDAVRITGVVAEFQGQTQISFPDVLTILSTGNTLPTASTVTMPFAALDSLEAVEGMLVTIPETLYVTEFFLLGRFGEVVVSSDARLAQPTAKVTPGAPAKAMQDSNNLNRLKIDDALNNQNADPIVYGGNGAPLTAANPLRGGDTVTGATGVMTYTWAGNSASPNAYRLRPATAPIAFQTANPRPSAAPDVGGSLKIASFNVLNYFLTLDDGGDDCGPAGNKQECRGAETALEYERQHVKLMAALDALDADVLGLIELENSEGVEPLAAIVDGLNAINGAGTYAYINTGNIGTDTIKVGIIYKPSKASPLRAHAIINSSVDPRFVDTLNRPSLAQSFFEKSTGEVMTLVVNHLKSKNCGGETGGDVDSGDGQACYSATRTAAAQALVKWITSHPTGVDDDDFLVMGDLNSYAKEDPIRVFADAHFVDLAGLHDDSYSFVFDGQWGYLDYALASPSLVAQIEGTAEYHINADEVPVLDYNTNFKSPGQIVSLFAPDEFRTSDHDPVVVGLDLDGNVDVAVVAVPILLWPANHTLRNVTVVAVDHRLRRQRVDILRTMSSEADSGLGKGDIAGDIVPVDHDTVKLRAERFGRFGRTYTIDVVVTKNHQAVVDAAYAFVLPSLFGHDGRHGP